MDVLDLVFLSVAALWVLVAARGLFDLAALPDLPPRGAEGAGARPSVTVVVPVCTVTAPAPSRLPRIEPPFSVCAPLDVTVVPAAMVAPPDCVKVAALMSTVPPVVPPDWAKAPLSV